jgi:hypothetical protein
MSSSWCSHESCQASAVVSLRFCGVMVSIAKVLLEHLRTNLVDVLDHWVYFGSESPVVRPLLAVCLFTRFDSVLDSLQWCFWILFAVDQANPCTDVLDLLVCLEQECANRGLEFRR